MNLNSLIKQIASNEVDVRYKSNNSKLETSKGIFDVYQDLYSDVDYTYYVLLTDLVDRAILEDNLHVLSIEQQNLLEQYFKEGHPHSKKWNEFDEGTVNVLNLQIDIDNKQMVTPVSVYNIYDFTTLTKHIKVLDDFLGSYIGEDNEQYSRYGEKQLYSEY